MFIETETTPNPAALKFRPGRQVMPAGTREFGSMPDTRAILQKGDNFRVPEKKEPQRYVAEFLSVKSIKGTGKPEVRFIREVLPGK